MALGKRVQEAREHRGLNQSQLAEIVGIQPQNINKLEKDDAKSSKYAPKIAEALNYRLNWLLTGEGERFSPNLSTSEKLAKLEKLAKTLDDDELDMFIKIFEGLGK